MAADGIAGHHNIFCDVLFIGLLRHFHPSLGFHNALGMGNAGAHPQQHRGVILLGKGKRSLYEVLGFLRIRRLQHGNLGGDGIVPGILLVLGGMHGGVICHADHKTAVDTGVGQGKQGVCGHVEANMLHGAAASHTGEGRAEGGFQRHLFIGRPFSIDFRKFGGLLGDLGGGGSGVAGDQAASGFIQATGHRTVADKQFFQCIAPFNAQADTL